MAHVAMTPVRRSLICLMLAAAVGCSTAAPPPDTGSTQGTTSGTATTPAQFAKGPFARMACSLPERWLLRILHGYFPGRSGEIQILPREPNFFGAWTHSGPWDYLQRVPMFLYGPGHVPAAGEIGRPVTMADLAPTLAQYLGQDFTTPDGEPLSESVETGADPPKLIVVVVWDAGGRNVMDYYGKAWPNVRKLIPQGAWYDHATVGSSPSVTPAVHTTLGTGVFPDRHGILDLRIRQGKALVGPILSGPQYLRVPTLADVYDRDNGNKPLVGFVASEPTLGMIGHGSFFQGGDRDLALGQREGVWGLTSDNRKFFTFRDYVNDLPGLDEAIRELDGRDGQLDGLWLGEDVFSDPYYILKTPAYAEYQTGVLREVILREGFGSDDIPDLLFTNYKQIDQVGHQWSWPSPQMDAVIRSSDKAIGDLVRILNREVGRGEWVLAVTADHGATPTSEYSGGFRIDQQTLTEAVNDAFDRDGDDVKVVQSFRVTQMWMNMPELKENGATLEDVSRFLMRYTEGDNEPSATDSPGERVLQAAFPSYVLKNLACDPRDGPA
jgi:hypothetical protein